MEFGDITILKNICFSDGVVDHSYRLGRPCIYSRIRASGLITRPVAFYELYGRLDYFDIQKLIKSLGFFIKMIILTFNLLTI